MECGGTQLGQCLNLQQRGRPPLPGGRDGLARSFVHCSTRHFRKERGSKRLAVGNPGAMTSRCVALYPRVTFSRGDVGCRLTWRTAQCLPKDRASRLGGNCWSRGQKVSLLLSFAQVECRLSSAPPISMTTLSTQIAVLPTRCLANCLQAGIQRH